MRIEKHHVDQTVESISSQSDKCNNFQPCNKFTNLAGDWIFTTSKGTTMKSDNIKDFEGIPGISITNAIHHFGYKYNKLYKVWRCFDFLENEYT